MTSIINLFGGPNTGKSTTASGLFYLMKVFGYNVELVTEYAKDMTYENRHNILSDQLYILAKQNRRLERVRDKVDFVVTDSPIILGLNYTPADYYESFHSQVFDVWNSYDNVNFYLKNNGDLTYNESGRNQDKSQAKALDEKIYKFLIDNNIDFNEQLIDAANKDLTSNHVGEIFIDVTGRDFWSELNG